MDALEAEQRAQAKFVISIDDRDWNTDANVVVGGADVAISSTDGSAHATLVIFHMKQMHDIHTLITTTPSCEVNPYVPGKFAIREGPLIIHLIKAAAAAGLAPGILLIDGNGVLHPRRFGLACAVGVAADLPTIGVSKSLFSVAGLDERGVRAAARRLLRRRGEWAALVGSDGLTYGAVLRSTGPCPQGGARPPAAVFQGVISSAPAAAAGIDPLTDAEGDGQTPFNPIYVSIGHRVCLETAVRIVASLCNYRVPEPIRLADAACRRSAGS